MQVPQLTPTEAKSRLDGGEDYVYLDVRTVPEFVSGHAPGALNIPVAEMNPALGRMEANPGFLRHVEATLPKDKPIVVGCKAGGRSQMAAEMLLQAGYRAVFNLKGGFHGVCGPGGDIIEEGWSTLGLPSERGDGSANGYAALQTRAST